MLPASRRIPIEEKLGFPTKDSNLPGIPLVVIELMVRTRRLYRGWWFTHYTFGAIAIVAGTLLTILSSSDAEKGWIANWSVYAPLIGIVATFSTSMVTFLGPLHKAERYFSAYHHIEQACLEFWGSDDDARARKLKLMRRVSQARKMLQAADPDELTATMPRSELAPLSS
jgi:hypothetical protein